MLDKFQLIFKAIFISKFKNYSKTIEILQGNDWKFQVFFIKEKINLCLKNQQLR